MYRSRIPIITLILFFVIFIKASALECEEYTNELYYYLGETLANWGNYETATSKFSCAIQLTNDENLLSQSLVGRASANIYIEQFDEAQRDIDRLMELDVDNIEVVILEIFMAHQSNNLDDAIHITQEAIADNPHETFLYILLGLLHHEASSFDVLVNDLSQYIETHPNLAILYAERGFAYQALGEDILAEADFMVSNSMSATIGLDYINYLSDPSIDITHGFLSHPDVLLRLCNRAIQISPDLPYVYVARGEFYMMLQQNLNAQRDFEQVLQLEPQNIMALLNLASIEYGDGNYVAAYELLSQAELADSENGLVKTRIGAMYVLQREFQNGVDMLSQAITLDSHIPLAYYARGLAYIGLGDLENALTDLEIAVMLEPANTDYIFSLAALYDELNHNVEALIYYRRYRDFTQIPDQYVEDRIQELGQN